MEQIKIRKKKKKIKRIGETELFRACESGNKDLVEYLVKHRVDINKENWNGETVLFRACESGNKDLVKFLVEYGADINKVYSNRKTAFYF